MVICSCSSVVSVSDDELADCWATGKAKCFADIRYAEIYSSN